MPIQSTDLHWRFSTTAGAAGFTTVGTAAGSLGKYVSTTAVPGGSLGNVFDDITGDENAAQQVDYRCVFFENAHPTLTLLRTVVWQVSEVTGGADIAVALDNLGVVPRGQAGAQAATIADDKTPPTGTTAFISPATKAQGLDVGDVPPGHVFAVWVRRTARNTPAQDNDGGTLRVEGDTAA